MIFITGNCQLKKENSSTEDLQKVVMWMYKLKHLAKYWVICYNYIVTKPGWDWDHNNTFVYHDFAGMINLFIVRTFLLQYTHLTMQINKHNWSHRSLYGSWHWYLNSNSKFFNTYYITFWVQILTFIMKPQSQICFLTYLQMCLQTCLQMRLQLWL